MKKKTEQKILQKNYLNHLFNTNEILAGADDTLGAMNELSEKKTKLAAQLV